MVIDEKAVFVAALEFSNAKEREAYLQEACAGRPELLNRLRELLSAHAEPLGPLDHGPAALGVGEAPCEYPGAVIGPYKLMEEIGAGGFGLVFVAEQLQPVRRKVAVKVIKPGMDTREVVARFEAERQALAMMDHPNIARVFDGGATPSGRPYFVMELVKGVPITEFDRQHQATLRERLKLFIDVCQATQHAHQKGVVHRDLKPANILVSLRDATPVVKVIDFGVAKAIGQQLTEKTVYTGITRMIGTPAYMSPEQAGMSDLDIDTRSDIYSLGVLLYELLTGTTPFDKERLQGASYDEIRRIIREEDPPRPSTRLSETLSAAHAGQSTKCETPRGTDSPRSALRVPRVDELDWVVMKCLEKDRNRRYETATELARDIERYLADEPVQACPPSKLYRLRKFTRRNKGAVLSVAAIFLLLIGGIAGTTWGLVRAEEALEAEAIQRKLAEDAATAERIAKRAEADQRNRAEIVHQKAAREAAMAAAINDFLNNELLLMARPLGAEYQGLTADVNLKFRTVLRRAATRIDDKFVDEPEVQMRLRYTIGFALHRVGDYAGALTQYQKVVPYFQETLGPAHPETLSAEHRMAVIHKLLGSSEKAVPLLEQSFAKHKAVLGPQHPQTLISMHGLAAAYCGEGKGGMEKGLPLYEETLELRKRHLGPAHPDTLVTMNNVAALYLGQMRIDKALPLFEEALAGMRTKLNTLHPERLNASSNLARAYHAAEQLDKVVPLQELTLHQFKLAYGLDDPATQNVIDNLIAYHVDMGRCDKAESLLNSIQIGGANRPSISNQRLTAPNPLDPITLGVFRNLSPKQRQELREKRHHELIERVRPAAEKYQEELAAKTADHPDTLAARQAFAVVLRTQSRNSAAAYHFKAVLDARQHGLPDDHGDVHASRLELGQMRLKQKKFADADVLFRDLLAVCEEQEPADWTTFRAQSLRGAALSGLKKYAEAEALLLDGYAGLEKHKSRIPAASKNCLVEARQRVVQLYVGWGKNDKADEWRKKLETQKKQ